MSDVPPTITFRSVQEALPAEKLRSVLAPLQPRYERWYLSEGDAARPSYQQSLRALHDHMPELAPTFHRMLDLLGGGELLARFLTLYRPPPYLTGCSQAIWTRGEPALARNYDYAPHLCDGILLDSAFSGTRTIAMLDCLWGVLDGINARGLAVALSFGGRKVVGDGFGIPVVLRYVLEIARTTAEAVAILERVPVHMSYNVAIVDARGDAATVRVAPDRPAVIDGAMVSTNHQGSVEWPEHAMLTHTLEREALLQSSMSECETLEELAKRFLKRPLYRTAWMRGAGTLYTAVYRPAMPGVEFRWPRLVWPHSFATFTEESHTIQFGPRMAGPVPSAIGAKGVSRRP